MRKCREWISLHFLILSPVPLHFLILFPFPRHLLILSPFPCIPDARMQQVVQPCHSLFTILFNSVRAPWEQSCHQENAPIVSGRGDGGSRSCWLQERLSDHPDHHCLKRYSVYIIQSIVPFQMWSFLSLSYHRNHHFLPCISTKSKELSDSNCDLF